MPTKLMLEFGVLYIDYLPLVYRYPEGDCDLVRFPFKDDEMEEQFKSVIFDLYQCGEIESSVELPDGRIVHVGE